MKRLSIPYNNQVALTGLVAEKPVDKGLFVYFKLRIEQEVETDAGWVTKCPKFTIIGQGEAADRIAEFQSWDCVAVDGHLTTYFKESLCTWLQGIKADHVELLAKKGEKWNL